MANGATVLLGLGAVGLAWWFFGGDASSRDVQQGQSLYNFNVSPLSAKPGGLVQVKAGPFPTEVVEIVVLIEHASAPGRWDRVYSQKTTAAFDVPVRFSTTEPVPSSVKVALETRAANGNTIASGMSTRPGALADLRRVVAIHA